MQERAITPRSAFAVLQPLVAVALLAMSVLGNVGCLAYAARGLVTKLVPAPSLQISPNEGDQVSIIPFFVADGQTFVVCHVLTETWMSLNLAPKQSFKNVFFWQFSHSRQGHFPIIHESSQLFSNHVNSK
jgi:hypothetical protein